MISYYVSEFRYIGPWMNIVVRSYGGMLVIVIRRRLASFASSLMLLESIVEYLIYFK